MQPTGGCHFRTCSVWPDTAVRIPQWFIVQWTSIRLKRSTGCIWHRKSLSLYGGCDTRLSRVCLLCLWGWCVGASERHDEPEQNKNFGGLTFAKNASGAWGYKVGGAGSVIPFKSLDIVYVGAITSSGSINVTSKCPNYKKMTAGDFLLDYQSMAVRLWDGKIGGSTINVSKSYNSSTGVLTLSNLSASSSTSYVRCTVGVYAKVN